jgi:hypothetical protein
LQAAARFADDAFGKDRVGRCEIAFRCAVFFVDPDGVKLELVHIPD